MPDQFIIQDGIIAWFDGPEWDAAVEAIFEKAAADVEDAARVNAPWADITGDARAGLKAEAGNDDGIISITLYHTVEYGLWLEVIQNGRFATIMPTLEQNAPAIMDRATREVSGLRS